MNNVITNIKKPYIIGAVILLVVVGGPVAYGFEHSPKAEYQKGLHYYKEKNYQKALPLFEEAAKQGYAPAEFKVGYMYEYGLGVPQDYSKAAYWIKKAEKQRYTKGEYYIDELRKLKHLLGGY